MPDQMPPQPKTPQMQPGGSNDRKFWLTVGGLILAIVVVAVLIIWQST